MPQTFLIFSKCFHHVFVYTKKTREKTTITSTSIKIPIQLQPPRLLLLFYCKIVRLPIPFFSTVLALLRVLFVHTTSIATKKAKDMLH